MFETSAMTMTDAERERRPGPVFRRPVVGEFPEEIKRHFREQYPILLDGSLPLNSDQGHFIRQARESMAKGRIDPDLLPAAILRETLEAVRASANPATKAGLAAIAPRRARIWWDGALLDDSDDILAGLDKPRPVLRFYDITGLESDAGRWNGMFDIDIALEEKGKSVDFWAADRVYVVELGLVHADGRFLRLARTNSAALPREGRGETGGAAAVLSNLRPNPHRGRVKIIPDAAAREWAERRPDRPDRDLETELVVHMLYRAFKAEGPRVLRRAPVLIRRDADVLAREYVQRGRRQRRAVAEREAASPSLLIARLDAIKPSEPVVLAYPPAIAAGARMAVAGGADRFAWCDSLTAMARMKAVAPPPVPEPLLAAPMPNTMPAAPQSDAARGSDGDSAIPTLATPVFEAAEDLRRKLAGLGSSLPVEPAKKTASARLRQYREDESKRRLARAGVRITRMALTLEGRMRPGARLRVAGRMVHADADGCFRLECVLTGRKAAIPMLAGDSKSLINVEWAGGPHEKKTALSKA